MKLAFSPKVTLENHDFAEALTVSPEPRFMGKTCPLAARFRYYI
jgi:hypothetical protein